MELHNIVKDAITALYHHPNDAVRAQADRWLQDFQHTIDAWQVSDSLLHDASSNLETLIFSSQTLRSKVQRDFEELPLEAFRPLRDSLYALLKKFSKGPPKVRTQISIGIAALAVHVSVEDWGDGGIVNWINNEMRINSEYIPGLLELLAVLPEEAYSYRIAARPERRRCFEKELASSAETAFSLLTACLTFAELKDQVLESFSSWLRLSRGISATLLASHPLVQAALLCLNAEQDQQHLEAAVNVVSELIHYTTTNGSGGASAQMPLIHILVPHVMGLKGQLRNPSKDEEDIKAVARLFADMGESYVELIASGSEESMLIVQALLEVSSHADYDISSMTYNFWHQLQLMLTRRDSYSSYESDDLIEEERKRRLNNFCLPFQMLVSLVIFRVEYPQDYDELSEEEHKDFKQIRYAVADALMDAAEVLGGEATLKILFMKLAEAANNISTDDNCKWRPVEAALYCIQVLSKFISLQEAEILPQVMALMAKLLDPPQLLQTVCATIGAYSKWINSAPVQQPILPPLVDILIKGMSTSENAAAAATLALKYICEDCRKQFSGSLGSLFHIYHIAISGESGYKVSPDDSMYLVEALSAVVTELASEDAKKALELLCLPAVTPLKEMIGHGGDFRQIPARQLTFHIDRLACIFRNVTQPEVVADALQGLWPLFKAIFDLRAWDTRTMESLCRACKYAVRTSGKFMGITIGAMLETIQTLYQTHNQSCFLYLSSEVIKIFGSDPACTSYLRSLIEMLFSHTTKLLLTIQEFTSRPDIADDCYLLASRCIRYCPDLFVTPPIFPSLVDCAMIGITIQHRDACRSILTFLSDVLDLQNSSGGDTYRAIIDSVILPRGGTLTRILIASLTGALPSSRIEEVSYVLLAFARSYGSRVSEWGKAVISLIPSSALTESERSRFLKSLTDVASSLLSGSSNGFTNVVEELSDVCRRNRTVQDIVQGALRPLDLHFTTAS